MRKLTFQRGLSMIEILVTLTIVAFGLLGLLGLQARSLNFQKDSFDRKSAAEMVAQIAERMRANHLGYMNGDYDDDLNFSAATPGVFGGCGPCTIAQVAARDLVQWQIELRRRLPNSAAYVEFDPANPQWITVTLAWPEPQAAGQLTTGADTVCDDIRTNIDATLPANYRCYRTRVFP